MRSRTLLASVLAASALAAAGAGFAAAPRAAGLDYSGGMTCYVRVRDLEKSVKWYEEKLGLKLLFRADEMGWCELESPLAGLQIGLSKVPKVDPDGGATIVFGVKDIDAARRSLESQGVRFQGKTEVHEGMVKLAVFLDPDGNGITLSESLSSE